MLSPTCFLKRSLWEEVVLAAFFGITSHVFYYKNGEHHMEAPMLFWLHVLAFMIIFYAKTAFEITQQNGLEAVLIFTTYLCALFTSIVVYRKIFHRLRQFPGPTMASITKLWHTANTLDCRNHILLDKLHKQYGEFVRTGEKSPATA